MCLRQSHIHTMSVMSDCSETCAGFDPISDDEYDITMYLLQDRCQEQVENICNYSSFDEQAENPQSVTVWQRQFYHPTRLTQEVSVMILKSCSHRGLNGTKTVNANIVDLTVIVLAQSRCFKN